MNGKTREIELAPVDKKAWRGKRLRAALGISNLWTLSSLRAA